MKINISPGMIIFMLGFCGLTIALADSTGEMGSKIPLTIFFLVIMSIGVALQLLPKEYIDGEFGEIGNHREFV